MSKINIIQFTPYFPPHTGGLETVAEQIGFHWKKQDFGDFIQVTTSCNQKDFLKKYDNIKYKGVSIGYKVGDIKHIIIPSIELVSNFPVYNFFHPKTYLIYAYLRKYSKKNSNIKVVTHTRFFLTTFFGGVFAKKQKIPFFHIEHGSGHAKLGSSFQTKMGIVYDKSLGKWTVKNANGVLAISNACKKFIKEKFINRDVEVIYRGIDIPTFSEKKEGGIKLVFIGRLVSLKGVEDLINAYKAIETDAELIIIGDGNEGKKLKEMSKGYSVTFLGFKQTDFVIEYLQYNRCIVVNPSHQEGLPTTVIEGLMTKCPVVASNVGGTSEISNGKDLLLFESQDIPGLQQCLKSAIDDYDNMTGISFKQVSEKFSWEKNITKLYQYIR